MIPRYARPDMTALWEAKSRFSIWLKLKPTPSMRW